VIAFQARRGLIQKWLAKTDDQRLAPVSRQEGDVPMTLYADLEMGLYRRDAGSYIVVF
jgi:hypothetical protein